LDGVLVVLVAVSLPAPPANRAPAVEFAVAPEVHDAPVVPVLCAVVSIVPTPVNDATLSSTPGPAAHATVNVIVA
jgi:hypothetical protein